MLYPSPQVWWRRADLFPPALFCPEIILQEFKPDLRVFSVLGLCPSFQEVQRNRHYASHSLTSPNWHKLAFWNRLPRETVESPPLKMFKEQVHMDLPNIGQGAMGVFSQRLDLTILVVFSNLNDSMILWKSLLGEINQSVPPKETWSVPPCDTPHQSALATNEHSCKCDFKINIPVLNRSFWSTRGRVGVH